MDNNLAALSMDLKRAAVGLHNNNLATAQKFISEAKKNIYHLKFDEKLYIKKVIENIDFSSPDNLLMSSQLVQNYVLHKR